MYGHGSVLGSQIMFKSRINETITTPYKRRDGPVWRLLLCSYKIGSFSFLLAVWGGLDGCPLFAACVSISEMR